MAGPSHGFEDLSATALFCPRCRAATPVRQHLLLVLPDGDLFEYRCARCATSVGTRKVSHGPAAPVRGSASGAPPPRARGRTRA